MSFRYEFRLSGEGGQGLILAGKIMAEAAAIYDDKNATQSQSYGPEARGGASRSEVIISDEDIDYPKATKVDLLLALTEEACKKYSKDIKEQGILLVDADSVKNIPPQNYKIYQVPIVRLALEQVGKALVANIVALGIISELTQVISNSALEQAILARVPKGTENLNLKAFRLGLEEGKKLKSKS
ncbi:2-oxoacid:acceptor oxidoreductase family protein [candidate division KSB1 bacterium]|nr:2-oxoacid:acceptor oxidoreductase family protein [candidate division KSB1 bacterium]